MPKDISDARERTAAGEHPTRQRVAQHVEPAASLPLIEADALQGACRMIVARLFAATNGSKGALCRTNTCRDAVAGRPLRR